MPRVKSFAEKEADRVRRERLATLPREVAQAVAAMKPAEADAYLASLDKVDQMEAAGQTFTPSVDPTAPYGTKADGTPRRKPGRRAAANPGARTKEKPEQSIGEKQLASMAYLAELEDCPEDDPDVPVIFGSIPRDPSAPAPVTAEDRDAAERAEQEAALKAALATHGITDVLVGPVAAVQRVQHGDPEVDLASLRVDHVPCELRVRDVGRAYRLEVRYPPVDCWEIIADTYHPDGSAATLTRMGIKPTDSDAWGRALNALDKPHRAVAAKFDNRPRDATGPKTKAEKERHNNEVRAQMVEARRSMALHRQPVAPGEERTWLSDML